MLYLSLSIVLFIVEICKVVSDTDTSATSRLTILRQEKKKKKVHVFKDKNTLLNYERL